MTSYFQFLNYLLPTYLIDDIIVTHDIELTNFKPSTNQTAVERFHDENPKLWAGNEVYRAKGNCCGRTNTVNLTTRLTLMGFEQIWIDKETSTSRPVPHGFAIRCHYIGPGAIVTTGEEKQALPS